MLDAISTSQLAMNIDQLKLQAINHNVANINTPGYKKETLEQASFAQWVDASISQAAQHLQKETVTVQGTLMQTNKNTDLALRGDGYFQVQGEQGIYFTRRGDFHLNAHGELVTATGETVLSSNGSIQIDNDSFTIDKQGFIFIDHQKTDQIQLAHFQHPEHLIDMGNGLYQSSESPDTAMNNSAVLQGFIERSNTTSIDEMLSMVNTSRHFEANQRILRTADNLLSSAINQLGESNV